MAENMSRGTTPTSSSTERDADAASFLGDPNCPICGGLGYIRRDLPLDDPNFGKLLPCTCRTGELQQSRTQALRKFSNLTVLERFTFAAFRPEGHGLPPDRQRNLHWAYDRSREYANDPKGWLLLRGGYGCGKTHLAAAIANTCVERGLPVIFITVPDLLDYLRGAFAPGSAEPYDERFDEIRTAPLLILDDLGTEHSTSWALEKLFQLLNYRHVNQLPTVITTNHELEDMEPRLRSRLSAVELVEIITITASDYRGQGVEHSHLELNTLPLYETMTFETFDLRQGELTQEDADNLQRAVQEARGYAVTPTGWLLLTGRYGCGKTHLAAAIANEWVRQGNQALFVVVPDLLDHLRAAYSPKSAETYDRRFEKVKHVSFLVLDDLGTESATVWAQEKLYQLFNYRYVTGLPTVITTAKPLEQLDERLRTRLLDVRRCTVFAITAPPYLGGAASKGKKKRGRSAG